MASNNYYNYEKALDVIQSNAPGVMARLAMNANNVHGDSTQPCTPGVIPRLAMSDYDIVERAPGENPSAAYYVEEQDEEIESFSTLGVVNDQELIPVRQHDNDQALQLASQYVGPPLPFDINDVVYLEAAMREPMLEVASVELMRQQLQSLKAAFQRLGTAYVEMTTTKTASSYRNLAQHMKEYDALMKASESMRLANFRNEYQALIRIAGQIEKQENLQSSLKTPKSNKRNQ